MMWYEAKIKPNYIQLSLAQLFGSLLAHWLHCALVN